MVAFESVYVPDNGDLSPAYAPFVGTLPPATERGFRSGGFAVPKDLTRADYRASWAVMVALLARMHQAGIRIVAGTDGSGIEIVRELEIYTQAGLTPAEALAAATIVPCTTGRPWKRIPAPSEWEKLPISFSVEGDPSKTHPATCGRHASSCLTASYSMLTRYATRQASRDGRNPHDCMGRHSTERCHHELPSAALTRCRLCQLYSLKKILPGAHNKRTFL